MGMFELGTLLRRTPKFNVTEIRDSLADRIDEDVLVQAIEGEDGFALFKGKVKEVAPVFEGRRKLSSMHAVLFWLYDSNGNLNGMHKTFGFSNQLCDLARVVREDGTPIYEESTLVKEWNRRYKYHRHKVNGFGDIHFYKNLLDKYHIRVE